MAERMHELYQKALLDPQRQRPPRPRELGPRRQRRPRAEESGGGDLSSSGEDGSALRRKAPLPRQTAHVSLHPDNQLAAFLATSSHPTPGTFGWDLGPGTGSDVGSLLDPHAMALLAGVGLGGIPLEDMPALDWPPRQQRPRGRGRSRLREASESGEEAGDLDTNAATATDGLSSLDVLVAAAISSDEPCQDAALNLLAAAAAIEEQTGGPNAAARVGLESDASAHVLLGDMVGSSHMGSSEKLVLMLGGTGDFGRRGAPSSESGGSAESESDAEEADAPVGATNPAMLLGASGELPWFLLPSSLEAFNDDSVHAGPPGGVGASVGRKRAAAADADRHDHKAPRVTKAALKEVSGWHCI